jgi:hypothetical protein
MTVLTGPAPYPYPLDADTAEIMSWRRIYPGRAERAGELRRLVSCSLADFPGLDEVVMAAAAMPGAVRSAHSSSVEAGSRGHSSPSAFSGRAALMAAVSSSRTSPGGLRSVYFGGTVTST